MAGENQKRACVLVVDDDPAAVYLLKQHLDQEGFDVLEARDAHEALALAKGRKPDLAILDVVMPVMLGWELCDKLKALYAPAYFPIIILTSKSAELDEIRSYESNADAHFTKPPNIPVLLDAIARLLQARVH